MSEGFVAPELALSDSGFMSGLVTICLSAQGQVRKSLECQVRMLAFLAAGWPARIFPDMVAVVLLLAYHALSWHSAGRISCHCWPAGDCFSGGMTFSMASKWNSLSEWAMGC